AFAASLRPAILDRDGATLNPTKFPQPLHECISQFPLGRSRGRAQEPDGRQLSRLLRARRERPCSRAAEQRYERAAPHSITSSAATWSVRGTRRPSAFAANRLITSSNLSSCLTGRSEALSPFRILPA